MKYAVTLIESGIVFQTNNLKKAKKVAFDYSRTGGGGREYQSARVNDLSNPVVVYDLANCNELFIYNFTQKLIKSWAN